VACTSSAETIRQLSSQYAADKVLVFSRSDIDMGNSAEAFRCPDEVRGIFKRLSGICDEEESVFIYSEDADFSLAAGMIVMTKDNVSAITSDNDHIGSLSKAKDLIVEIKALKVISEAKEQSRLTQPEAIRLLKDAALWNHRSSKGSQTDEGRREVIAYRHNYLEKWMKEGWITRLPTGEDWKLTDIGREMLQIFG